MSFHNNGNYWRLRQFDDFLLSNSLVTGRISHVQTNSQAGRSPKQQFGAEEANVINRWECEREAFQRFLKKSFFKHPYVQTNQFLVNIMSVQSKTTAMLKYYSDGHEMDGQADRPTTWCFWFHNGCILLDIIQIILCISLAPSIQGSQSVFQILITESTHHPGEVRKLLLCLFYRCENWQRGEVIVICPSSHGNFMTQMGIKPRSPDSVLWFSHRTNLHPMPGIDYYLLHYQLFIIPCVYCALI